MLRQVSLAGLAILWLEMASLSLDDVLAFLAKMPRGTGMGYPFRVYLDCYHVLRWRGDERSRPFLAQAYEFLLARTAQIEDLALRVSFWENVPEHKELHRFYLLQCVGE